jgi:hypothetical protein
VSCGDPSAEQLVRFLEEVCNPRGHTGYSKYMGRYDVVRWHRWFAPYDWHLDYLQPDSDCRKQVRVAELGIDPNVCTFYQSGEGKERY